MGIFHCVHPQVKKYFILFLFTLVAIYSLDSCQITTIRDNEKECMCLPKISGCWTSLMSFLDEKLKEMCLAIHSQMLGHILLIPGSFAQFVETWQKEVIFSPRLVQK